MGEWSDHFDDLELLQKEVGFTQTVRLGNMVYLAGTGALLNDMTAAHPNQFDAQLDFVYRAIKKTLLQFGVFHKDIVREVMYVTDMAKLVAAMPLRKAFYNDGRGPFSGIHWRGCRGLGTARAHDRSRGYRTDSLRRSERRLTASPLQRSAVPGLTECSRPLEV